MSADRRRDPRFGPLVRPVFAHRPVAWGLAAAMIACGGGGEDGLSDAAEGGEHGGGEEAEACGERLLFRFALGAREVAALGAAGGGLPPEADRLRATLIDGVTNLPVAEDEVPAAQGALLALPDEPAARLELRALDEEGEVVARGELALGDAPPASGAAIPLGAVPSAWEEFGRASCDAPALSARWGHTVTPLGDGRLLVAGGASWAGGDAVPSLDELVAPLTELAVFDPTTGALAAVGALPVGVVHHTATRMPDGRVAIAGGHNLEGDALLPTSAVWLVDPASDFAVAPGVTPLSSPRAHHAAIWVSPADALLLVGGNTGGNNAERWSPASGSGPVQASQARTRHTLTPIPELGIAIAIGGLLPGAQPAASFEVFELTAEPSSTGAFGLPDHGERSLHGAAWLPGVQRLYAVGGFRDGALRLPTPTVLRWDAATQAFALDPTPLSAARGAPVAFALPEQDVIWIGGGVGTQGVRADAEALAVVRNPPPLDGLQTFNTAAPAPPAPVFGAPLAPSGGLIRVFPSAAFGASVWVYTP